MVERQLLFTVLLKVQSCRALLRVEFFVVGLATFRRKYRAS
jgi:hypothetical protein